MCNVLIMGKTGTGKSSLLNYLCGQNLAKAGAGKPVTEEGLYEYKVSINNQDVKIFDSWGIEAGKVDRWNKLIEDSLQEHGVQKSMEDWFHSVIYCIQAGGGRVEDVDSEIIRKFLGEGYHLTIVLTKADQIDEDDEKKMKDVILQEIKGAVTAEKQGLLKVVATCSEEKVTRSGTSHQFGKEEVQNAILEGWKDTIIDRMPKHVIYSLCELIDDWANDWKTSIQTSDKISGVGDYNKDIYKTIAEDAKIACQQIQDDRLPIILKESIESCHKANASLKKVFDIQVNDKLFDTDILNNTESTLLFVIKNFIQGLFILPTVVKFFNMLSKKSIETQKENLCNYVNDVAAKLNEELKNLEPNVSKIITDALA